MSDDTREEYSGGYEIAVRGEHAIDLYAPDGSPLGVFPSFEDIDGEIAARKGPATLALLNQARDALRILNDRYGPDSGANLGHDVEDGITLCCDHYDDFRSALVDAGELTLEEGRTEAA